MGAAGLRIVALAVLLVPLGGGAEELAGERQRVCAFAEDTLRQRCRRLLQELRCPQCPNQSLADSPGPLSEDLRQQLHAMIAEGQSDKEILAYMTERYGNFIRFRPPWNRHTSWLWLAPAAFALLSAALAWGVLRRTRRGET